MLAFFHIYLWKAVFLSYCNKIKPIINQIINIQIKKVEKNTNLQHAWFVFCLFYFVYNTKTEI